MLAIFTFFIFYSVHSTVSQSVPSPINVTFSSVNLRNVLHWFPGNGSHTDETLFTVEYAIYGDRIQGKKGKRVNWRAVQHCTEIVRTWCDLSSETWDADQGYHAKVRAVERGASSKWAFIPRRFDPKIDTTLGPPLLYVVIENNSAIITMKGPMRYPSNNHTPALSMVTFYPGMTYNLSVHNTRQNYTRYFPVVGSVYKYRLMEYNTEYCFSAQSKFLSMPIHCQSSAWLCITTPQDPVIEQLQSVIVGIVVPALCIGMIIVAGCLLHHHLSGKDEDSPNMLTQSFHKSPLTLLPESRNLITSSLIIPELPGNLSVPKHPIYSPQVVDPPPSYSPQRHEAPLEPEEPLDDLSIDYGGISMAPRMTDEGEVRGGSCEDGERRVESVHSGAYAPQANTSWTCRQTPMQMHGRSSAGLQSFQGSAICGVNKKDMDGEIGSLLVSIRLNLQTMEEMERGEELCGEVIWSTDREGVANRGVEEGSNCENVPLISAYAPQNIQNMSASHSDQSDISQDDFSVNHERGLDVPLLSERGRRRSEEEYVTRARLRLDNVSVSRASDEEEEA